VEVEVVEVRSTVPIVVEQYSTAMAVGSPATAAATSSVIAINRNNAGNS
jgi:hypothetical protein